MVVWTTVKVEQLTVQQVLAALVESGDMAEAADHIGLLAQLEAEAVGVEGGACRC